MLYYEISSHFLNMRYLILDPAHLTLTSLQFMKSALHSHFLNGSSPKEHDQRVFWFLEQLGRIKSFITNKLVKTTFLLIKLVFGDLSSRWGKRLNNCFILMVVFLLKQIKSQSIFYFHYYLYIVLLILNLSKFQKIF